MEMMREVIEFGKGGQRAMCSGGENRNSRTAETSCFGTVAEASPQTSLFWVMIPAPPNKARSTPRRLGEALTKGGLA